MTMTATTIPNAIAMRGPRAAGGAAGGKGSVIMKASRGQMLQAASRKNPAFQGMTTANCCITVDLAASKPGARAGPSTWMTTR